MLSLSRLLAVILMVSLGCTATRAQTHFVDVDSDGQFSPRRLVINAGDTVTWRFSNRQTAVVELRSAPAGSRCVAFAPWDPDAENPFTGPMPEAASGIVALAPHEVARAAVPLDAAPAQCGSGAGAVDDGTDILCPIEDLPRHRVLQEVLDHPAVRIVYIRVDWNEIEPEPGQYDFAALDVEIDRIIGAGKLYSIGVRAGKHGTPDWLGDVLHMPLFQFRDSGSGAGSESCGAEMYLADPTDPPYGLRYNQMMQALARHLQANAARWRALAYVKPSGANLYTHENRLPKRCRRDCGICNTEVWAAAGYTPEGLYDFYERQFRSIAEFFPGKSMSYMLIQDGFPLVTDSEHYAGCLTPECEGTIAPTWWGLPAVSFLPEFAEQTMAVLDIGVADHGGSFVIQHNGLGPGPSSCAATGIHPADPTPGDGIPPEIDEFDAAGSGCPNRYVLYHGARGQHTGWQTGNTAVLNTLLDVDAALVNAYENSDGIFVEFYEQLIWLDARSGAGPLDASGSGLSLEEWSELFDVRRRRAGSFWPDPGDPYPLEYSHTFQNAGPAELRYQYTDPATCSERGARPNRTIGTIIVRP